MENKINIAIDGPAGAGKSTVAKLVAEKLEFIYIDTGAMYRALTLKAIENKVDLKNEKELTNLLTNTTIELTTTARVFLDEEDVSEQIRSLEVTNSVSFVASHSSVRFEMLDRQRSMAQNGGTVMDGRDIGTAVLPNAQVKVFLSASVDERARRRYEENVAKGFSTNFEQLKQEIALRDKRDSERETAPLKKAKDAIEIDTTHLSIDEVVSSILLIVAERT
ncbi:(d)CMP kinase [Anaerobacillus isosaccharinicus]|uniref:Cytidylate kinase n=1 Tax=Anaerobacillus isosaccharinicus TaxID=1532552 RepID=A0A1S2KVR4_9BACI|nr:(d)CMP kinase [Anaerobacillus isosaccharinicus]MBA5585834.1 (d)CMP kinase [Anaerobacillus isosaccharinicus]QOY35870.1 (d)CMP kinase [Anaerobacillus isosaccharinicus]